MHSRTAAVVAFFAFVACGDNKPVIPLESLTAALKEAHCRHLVRCGLFADINICLNEGIVVQPGFRIDPRVTPTVVAAVESGRVAYNGDEALECVEALANRSCDSSQESARVPPRACGQLFTGALEDSALCFSSHECMSQQCSGVNDELCLPGVCVGDTSSTDALPGLGEICANGLCAAGAFCDPTRFMCIRLRRAGEECMFFDLEECAYGYVCQYVSGGGPPVCTEPAALGEPCGGGCRDIGAYCDTDTGLCTPYLLDGQPCEQATCSPYFECIGGTCGGWRGKECRTEHDCADGYCDTVLSGTCVLGAPVGAACMFLEQCASRYCDGGLCASLPVCALQEGA
jgi:hypothetical protein